MAVETIAGITIAGTRIGGITFERLGSGPPVLLIHGIGHRRQMWTPLLDDLSRDHEVIAVDLPGFGASDPLPADLDPTIGHLADVLVGLLDALAWVAPDVVGSSLGGWLGLELARRGRAASVTGLCSAGLWNGRGRQRLIRLLFALWVGSVRAVPGAIPFLRFRAVRTLALFGLFGRPWKVPGPVAVDDARGLAACDFQRTFDAVVGRSFSGGQAIDVPVTLAYADLDPLVRRRQSTHDELPRAVRLVRLRGCGHVPTWDDPGTCLYVIRGTLTR